jgi:hypothetical protein
MLWSLAPTVLFFFRLEELEGGVRAEQGAAAGWLRVLPVGEEDAGGATNPQVQQLPLLAHSALPMALDRAGSRYNSVEDTLARANAWILSSQASGVPIAFLNVRAD